MVPNGTKPLMFRSHIFNIITEYLENLHSEYHFWQMFIHSRFATNLANVFRDDLFPALFISLTDKRFCWQSEVEIDWIECNPSTVISTPACWSVDTYHLDRDKAEIVLCGFTKLSRKLLDFLLLFITLPCISLGVTVTDSVTVSH